MTDITLHMICKDEVQKVNTIVNLYALYFKEIHLAVDEKFEEFKKLESDKVRVFQYEQSQEEKDFGGIFFDRKRNFLVSKCLTEYYFRMDTDDTIANPENIDALVKRALKENISVVSTYYDYAKDEWGSTNAAHYRETIIQNVPFLYWNKHIHENVLPKRNFNFAIVQDDTLHIIHNVEKDHALKSVQRNAKYLIAEYKRDGEKTDLRTIAYLGRSFMGVGDFKKAIFFLEQHIKGSGWKEDRYLSWCQMSHMYRAMNEFSQSLACAFEALQEVPDYPDAYFEIHDTYFQQEKWEKSIEWGTMGFSKPKPKTNILIDPSNYTWRPTMSMACCYYMIGEFDKAWQLFQKVKEYVPNLPYVKTEEKNYETAYYHNKYVNHFSWLLSYTRDKNPDGVVELVKSVPRDLYQHDAIAKARNSFLPVKTWDNNSIEIFCGTTWEQWSPKSVDTGIGGSEEAVIQLSKQLTKLGFNITVYCDCGDDEGEYEGVQYKNIVLFNPKDAHNILIAWRSNIFIYGIEARKKILWIHDSPLNIPFDDKSINTFDKIVVLSQYHKSLLPDNIPDEKIYVSTNGINPDDFVGVESVRNPHRLIYASSYNRGLETILDMWEDIRKAVPDAELHIYYGWNAYDRAVASGDVQDKGWKAQVCSKMEQPGVTEHGRVGHKELVQEYAKAGIWAYPCEYAGEINCIALTKAIAAGCIPVTNDAYVMKERNPICVTDDKFKETLIKALSGQVTFVTPTDYIKDNSWETVAKEWTKDILFEDVPTNLGAIIG